MKLDYSHFGTGFVQSSFEVQLSGEIETGFESRSMHGCNVTCVFDFVINFGSKLQVWVHVSSAAPCFSPGKTNELQVRALAKVEFGT